MSVPTLRGLTTVRYHASDFEGAKRWYAELLGVEPYFNRGPAYSEFRIGDYQHELGILNSQFVGELGGGAGKGEASGVVVYWHVDDLAAMLDRLVAMGATIHEPAREFGPGYTGASVLDPFGNILGVMSNQHYLDVLNARASA